MKEIHNRMPVILNKSDEEVWVNPDTDPDHALKILEHSTPAAIMEAYQVSNKVNRPRYDHADLLKPATQN
jgi:putative SOS response-associated peptidase YedK